MTSPITCRLARAAELAPDATAVAAPEGSWTFAELDAEVSARARALRAAGCRPGRWVAAVLRSDRAGVIDWLAILRAGALALPIPPRMPEAARDALLAEHGITQLIPEAGAAPILDTPAEPAAGSASVALHRTLPPNAACGGILTSGSTGEPRVVVHSYANHVRSAQGSARLIPLGPGDRYLLSLPIHHVGGLAILFRCLEGRATLVLGGRAEDPDFLAAEGVTHVSMVETQLRRLLDAAGPAPALRCILLGGGPVAEEVLERARQRGLQCLTSYGLTEMSSQVVTRSPDGRDVVLPHRELALADDGEIRVRGGTRCLGYLRRGRIEGIADPEGWLATGDLGRWRDGRLEILGRKDNRFISGGENIQPEAIEAALREHPAIEQAVVVPRPDPEFGHRPAAFLRGGTLPSPESLRAWLRERISPHLLPVAFYPLPEQEGLKVRRRDLAERLRREVREGDGCG